MNIAGPGVRQESVITINPEKESCKEDKGCVTTAIADVVTMK